MTSQAGPSTLAERVLGSLIRDDEWREAVLGDLREEFAQVSETRGPSAAQRWHWQQVVRIGLGRLVGHSPARVFRARKDGPGEPRAQGASFAGLQRDLSYAVRSLARRPGLSAVIVLVLGIGLGANATMLSVADALVLRPFRFATVDRLIVIGSVGPNEFFDTESVAPGDFLEWKDELRGTTDLAAIDWWEPNMVGRDEPEQLAGFRVSPGYFDTLAVKAQIGRTFLPDEGATGQDRRVVIGHSLWTRRFASDPAIVGQTLRLDGDLYDVVGIAPPGFKIPLGADIWAPLALGAEDRSNRKNGNLTVIGRLADGTSFSAARTEIEGIVARQREQYPETNAKRAVTVKTFMRGMSDPGSGPFIAIFQLAALLLLLVACANVANLLLARGVERQQEFAVRLALGAGRARIARQLLLEGAILAACAVVLAVPLAWLGVTASRLAIPVSVIRFIPGWDYLGLEPRSLVVTCVLGMLAAIFFSWAPAFQGTRAAIGDALRQGGRTMTAGRTRTWGRALLASAQIGLTLALLTASALAVIAARDATEGDQGFDPNDVLVARMLLPNNPYDDDERRRQFVEMVIDRVRVVPAVQSVASTSAVPYGSQNASRSFYPEGVDLRQAEARFVDLRRVTPGVFDVLRIPLVAGRSFTTADTADSVPVAVVSRAVADRYWPAADALGRRFRLAEQGPWLTVVGIVGDVTHDWFLRQRRPTVYRPSAQDPAYNLNIVVRTAGDPLPLAGDLRRAVAAADPEQPIRELRTLRQVVDDNSAGLVYAARSLTIIGVIALMLALVGIYSLMAYLASRRSREIGVRLAFGATRWDIIRLTVLQASRITAAGIVVGLLMAFGVGQAMQALLFDSVSTNATLSVVLAVLLAGASLLASYFPARRSAGLDPTDALRAE